MSFIRIFIERISFYIYSTVQIFYSITMITIRILLWTNQPNSYSEKLGVNEKNKNQDSTRLDQAKSYKFCRLFPIRLHWKAAIMINGPCRSLWGTASCN